MTQAERGRTRRWPVVWLLVAGLLTTGMAVAVAHTESRWQVKVDFKRWSVGASDSIEFNPEGVRVRRTKAYHLGPVTIFSEQVWTEAKPHANRGGG